MTLSDWNLIWGPSPPLPRFIFSGLQVLEDLKIFLWSRGPCWGGIIVWGQRSVFFYNLQPRLKDWLTLTHHWRHWYKSDRRVRCSDFHHRRIQTHGSWADLGSSIWHPGIIHYSLVIQTCILLCLKYICPMSVHRELLWPIWHYYCLDSPGLWLMVTFALFPLSWVLSGLTWMFDGEVGKVLRSQIAPVSTLVVQEEMFNSLQ